MTPNIQMVFISFNNDTGCVPSGAGRTAYLQEYIPSSHRFSEVWVFFNHCLTF